MEFNSELCAFCHFRNRGIVDGLYSSYCSTSCANQAKSSSQYSYGRTNNVCLMCRVRPRTGNHHFCGRPDAEMAESMAPLLLEVPSDHVTFGDIENQFKSSWKHPNKAIPTLHRVYKIVESQSFRANYEVYRVGVDWRGQFMASNLAPGNECRRWHGTKRACNLGDPGVTQLCYNTNCALCNIIRTSFDLGHSGNNFGWERFGKGIYTSATSSKSDDYNQNLVYSPYKALLLNTVIVGQAIKLTQNSPYLTAPPAGYDSVIGEASPSSVLNYDELVVYTNDAIRPSYLVVYT